MLSPSRIRLVTAIAIALAVPACPFAQDVKPALKSGIIVGTAVDVNDDPVPNATVELKNAERGDRRTATTEELVFFLEILQSEPQSGSVSAWLRSSSSADSPREVVMRSNAAKPIKRA